MILLNHMLRLQLWSMEMDFMMRSCVKSGTYHAGGSGCYAHGAGISQGRCPTGRYQSGDRWVLLVHTVMELVHSVALVWLLQLG